MMTKQEIAELLQVSITDIELWVQQWAFSDWLDICPGQSDKVHDEIFEHQGELSTIWINNKAKELGVNIDKELIDKLQKTSPRKQ